MMSVLEIVRQYFSPEVKERKPNEIYVTDLSYCSIYKDLSKDFPDRVQLVGEIIHYAVEDALKRAGFECEKEVSTTYGNYLIKGKVDCYRPDVGVVEIKSSSSFQVSHAVQLGFYLWLMKINRGVLLYINKSNFKEIEVRLINNKLVINDDKVRVIDFNPEKYIKMYLSGNYVHPFNECSTCFFFRSCPYVNNFVELK